MKIDFTLKIYKNLLKAFRSQNYQFLKLEQYLIDFPSVKTQPITDHSLTITHYSSRITHHSLLILRHDVDRLPQNALRTAIIEHEIGLKGTYYFRVVPESYDLEVMEKIAQLGHEIGYHYEDVNLTVKRKKEKRKRKKLKEEELIDLAYESFCKNLEMLRKNFDIKTICMHGSPRSKYDNKLIWSKYDYRELGIIGEPYFDIDFSEFAYYTDTGRRWDGEGVSVRDKISSKGWLSPKDQRLKKKEWNLKFRTTQDIIKAAEHCKLPDKIMITVHPQRWTNNPALWLRELIWQNTKNVIKKYYFVNRAKYSVR